jgi:hypothetical protein
MGQRNPVNEKQVVIDGVKVELEQYGGKVNLKEISAITVGQGNGSKVLDAILASAEQAGVDVIVTPESIGKTPKNRLIEWYKRHGFEEHTQGRMIYRAGTNKSTARSVPRTGEQPSLEEIGDTLPASSTPPAATPPEPVQGPAPVPEQSVLDDIDSLTRVLAEANRRTQERINASGIDLESPPLKKSEVVEGESVYDGKGRAWTVGNGKQMIPSFSQPAIQGVQNEIVEGKPYPFKDAVKRDWGWSADVAAWRRGRSSSSVPPKLAAIAAKEKARKAKKPAPATEPAASAKPPELMTPEEAFRTFDTWKGKSTFNSEGQHRNEVGRAVVQNKPVSAAAVDAYGITLPSGYVRDGDRYVFKAPTKSAALKASTTAKANKPTESKNIPEGAVRLYPTVETFLMGPRHYVWDAKGNKYYVSNHNWREPISGTFGIENTPGVLSLVIRKIKPDGSHGPDIHTDLSKMILYGESNESIKAKAMAEKERDDRRKASTTAKASPAPVASATVTSVKTTDPRMLSDDELEQEERQLKDATRPLYERFNMLGPNGRFVRGTTTPTPAAQAIDTELKPYADRIRSILQEKTRRSMEKRNRENAEARDKRIREAEVFQRINGWEIVRDGVDYVGRHPDTKEDHFRGKLSRVRENAKESQPERTPTPPPPSPSAALKSSLTAKAKGAVKVQTDAKGDVTVSVPSKDKPGLPPKEQKKFLLAEIDKAIETAPDEIFEKQNSDAIKDLDNRKKSLETERDELHGKLSRYNQDSEQTEASPFPRVEQARQERLAEYAPNVAAWRKRYAEIVKESLALDIERRNILGTVTIEVPDDGTFEIINSKDALKKFRDQAKKFPTSATASTSAKQPQQPSAIIKVSKSRPTDRSDMEDAVGIAKSTDPTRAMINNIHVDGKNKVMVGTDGRRMAVAMNAPFPTTKHMVEETKSEKNAATGKMEEVKTGKMVEGQFPNYNQVIPGGREGKMPDVSNMQTATVNTEDIARKVNQAVAASKAIGQGHFDVGNKEPSVSLYLMPDGSLELATTEPEAGGYESGPVSKGTLIGNFNAEFLKDGMTFLRKMGNGEGKIAWSDARAPVVIMGKNEFYVLMPMRLDGDKQTGMMLRDVPATPTAPRYERLTQQPTKGQVTDETSSTISPETGRTQGVRLSDADRRGALDRYRRGVREGAKGPSGQAHAKRIEGAQYDPLAARTPAFRGIEQQFAARGVTAIPVRGLARSFIDGDVMLVSTDQGPARMQQSADHELSHLDLRRGNATVQAQVDAVDFESKAFSGFIDQYRTHAPDVLVEIYAEAQATAERNGTDAEAEFNKIMADELVAYWNSGRDEYAGAFRDEGEARKLRDEWKAGKGKDEQGRSDSIRHEALPPTPAQDAAYMEAVNRRDMVEAQRMVDEAAKRAGFNVGPVWHGSKHGEFASFDPNAKNVTDVGLYGKGFYFTPDKEYADKYGPSR